VPRNSHSLTVPSPSGHQEVNQPCFERPTILIVDDEPTALASMLDALTGRFGAATTGVERHLSAHSALDAVSRLKAGRRGDRAGHRSDQWNARDERQRVSRACAQHRAHGQTRAARLLGRPRASPSSCRPAPWASSTITSTSPGRPPRCICIRTSVNFSRNGRGSIAPGWS